MTGVCGDWLDRYLSGPFLRPSAFCIQGLFLVFGSSPE